MLSFAAIANIGGFAKLWTMLFDKVMTDRVALTTSATTFPVTNEIVFQAEMGDKATSSVDATVGDSAYGRLVACDRAVLDLPSYG